MPTPIEEFAAKLVDRLKGDAYAAFTFKDELKTYEKLAKQPATPAVDNTEAIKKTEELLALLKGGAAKPAAKSPAAKPADKPAGEGKPAKEGKTKVGVRVAGSPGAAVAGGADAAAPVE